MKRTTTLVSGFSPSKLFCDSRGENRCLSGIGSSIRMIIATHVRSLSGPIYHTNFRRAVELSGRISESFRLRRVLLFIRRRTIAEHRRRYEKEGCIRIMPMDGANERNHGCREGAYVQWLAVVVVAEVVGTEGNHDGVGSFAGWKGVAVVGILGSVLCPTSRHRYVIRNTICGVSHKTYATPCNNVILCLQRLGSQDSISVGVILKLSRDCAREYAVQPITDRNRVAYEFDLPVGPAIRPKSTVGRDVTDKDAPEQCLRSLSQLNSMGAICQSSWC